jgi:histidine triad (HIT) family protein
MPSIFTKIIKGEISSYKVAENDEFFAFLDINPLAEGHVLVIPKKEIDYIFDIDSNLYSRFFVFAKAVAKAIEKVIACERIGVSVVGLEVPHAHIHLIPINNVEDMSFAKQRVKVSSENMARLAQNISESFRN